MCMLINNDDIVLSVCLELHGANAYCYILTSSLRPYSLLRIKKHNANIGFFLTPWWHQASSCHFVILHFDCMSLNFRHDSSPQKIFEDFDVQEQLLEVQGPGQGLEIQEQKELDF